MRIKYKNIFHLFIFIFTPTSLLYSACAWSAAEKYKDPSLSIDERVQDLLSKMTMEEKVAQLQAIWIKRQELETDSGEFTPKRAKDVIGLGIGQVARPSENKSSGSPNKTPVETVAFVNALQKWLIENTRLGIPAIFHEEALHGHAARDATSYPQAIGLASTWDEELVQQIYSAIAAETRRRGGTQALTPILDVARDPRWGRIEETMGEDPYLVSVLGVASVRGFQGEIAGVIGKDKVIATLKHMAGHGEPKGGLNTAPAPIGERTLREIFLTPFEAAIKLAGARSVMASYNEIDGVPSHANKKMMTGILRDEWGFEGTVVSDYFAIAELITRHAVVENKAEAARISLTSGIDIEMPDGDTFKLLPTLVKQGKIDIELIDRAVARVLHEKFLLGLFENPYTPIEGVDEFVGNDTHRALAQKAAEKAIILLRNDESLLPLDDKKIKSLAVIGPHADDVLLGGYSDVPENGVSTLQGIKNYLGASVKINHALGTQLTLNDWQAGHDSVEKSSLSKERWHRDEVTVASAEDNKGLIEKAVEAAKDSDIAILVLGDNEATSREAWAETHLGDRTSLALFGEQEELMQAVIATGTPTVLILLNGRPVSFNPDTPLPNAILEAWYLGQETGTAIARTLFGDNNPGAKLPLSIPRSAGHIPAYYNHKPSAKRGYAFDETTPLFPFGFGLSYSTFEYSDLNLNKNQAKAGDTIEVSLSVENTSERAGDEVVQLYIRDKVSSLTRPVKELKGFKRIHLAAGEKTKLIFELPINLLGFYDHEMKYIIEPGDIELMIGSSSADIHLKDSFTIVGTTVNAGDTKAFITKTRIEQP